MEPMESTDGYFESYENIEVHELMLTDQPRNNSYRQAISDNRASIQGKVVLDVGAGTGILSIFCAQAGASKVYAVEASNTYKIAEDIVKENKFEQVIQVIHSKVEDLILPEKVDVIVSEWMGFYLLHEGMLDSVIKARDKFLKPNGLLFPESATLYSSPCSLPSMFDSWRDVAGVSMLSFSQILRKEAAQKPLTRVIPQGEVLSDAEVVCWLDLREVTADDLNSFKIQHMAVANRDAKYQGICLWFACTFPSSTTEPVTLTTEPGEDDTHWKQTIVVLPVEVQVEENSPIAYELSLSRQTEQSITRKYNIEVAMLDPAEIDHPEYCSCHMTKCILVRAMLEKYEQDSLRPSS